MHRLHVNVHMFISCCIQGNLYSHIIYLWYKILYIIVCKHTLLFNIICQGNILFWRTSLLDSKVRVYVLTGSTPRFVRCWLPWQHTLISIDRHTKVPSVPFAAKLVIHWIGSCRLYCMGGGGGWVGGVD